MYTVWPNCYVIHYCNHVIHYHDYVTIMWFTTAIMWSTTTIMWLSCDPLPQSCDSSLSPLSQVLGQCPTVSIDKTDGCQVFLSKASIKAEIITAKSSEMNICIPVEGGDYVSHSPSPSPPPLHIGPLSLPLPPPYLTPLPQYLPRYRAPKHKAINHAVLGKSQLTFLYYVH